MKFNVTVIYLVVLREEMSKLLDKAKICKFLNYNGNSLNLSVISNLVDFKSC
jgi:hypothetical protein